jgi:hypothetical protein
VIAMPVAMEVHHWCDRPGFRADLNRMLTACPPEAERLTWALFNLRAHGSEQALAIVDRFRAAPGDRVILSWGQLRALAAEFGEVQWGMFAGFSTCEDIVRPAHRDFFDRTVLTLEAFDGWLWRVVAARPDLVTGFPARFKAWAGVDVPEAPWWI